MNKGILLAGGAGSRLHPVTRAVSKQLLPIYDKPMIYYPLATVMLSGVRDVLVITTPHEQDAFQRLLGDGGEIGLRISWAVQPEPGGIAQAFLIGRDFVGSDDVMLALGDNIFYSQGFADELRAAAARRRGATVFGYRVRDPERYGVVEFDSQGRAVGLEEKPARPRSPFAVTGLYFYDNRVLDVAASLAPSPRGELEITDLNQLYLDRGDLHVQILGRGTAWLDTGTPEALLQASTFIQAIEERQGLKVSCPEEVALHMGFVDEAHVLRLTTKMGQSPYGLYLRQVVEEMRRDSVALPAEAAGSQGRMPA